MKFRLGRFCQTWKKLIHKQMMLLLLMKCCTFETGDLTELFRNNIFVVDKDDRFRTLYF